MIEILIILTAIAIMLLYNLWSSRSRLNKADLVGTESVLILVKRNCGQAVKNGLLSSPQIHLSHLPEPLGLDKDYSAIIPDGTKIVITDNGKYLSEELVANRPTSGVLYLQNTFEVKNGLWLTAIVMCFWAVLFGDDHFNFIEQYETYLSLTVAFFYLLYYFKLYKANYVLIPYVK